MEGMGGGVLVVVVTGRDIISHGATAAAIPFTAHEVKFNNDTKGVRELTEVVAFEEVRIVGTNAASTFRWRD